MRDEKIITVEDLSPAVSDSVGPYQVPAFSLVSCTSQDKQDDNFYSTVNEINGKGEANVPDEDVRRAFVKLGYFLGGYSSALRDIDLIRIYQKSKRVKNGCS